METLKISIITDKSSWMVPYSEMLIDRLKNYGQNPVLLYDTKELVSVDILFILSYSRIISQEVLNLNTHNIVVHASDLPKGKGWSPSTYSILNGDNFLTLSMFEATKEVDAGDIYLKQIVSLNGYELIDEWREKLALSIVDMCEYFVLNHKTIKPKKQIGNSSFYLKRTKEDSKLDINKSIKEQFNLLRVVDNENYLAFFEIDGNRYKIKIYKDKR